MDKRIGGGIKKCLGCKSDNYDGGKYCVPCRKIVLAEFKEKNRLKRIERKNRKNGEVPNVSLPQ